MVKIEELKFLRVNFRRVFNNNVMDILDCSFNYSGEEFFVFDLGDRVFFLISSRFIFFLSYGLLCFFFFSNKFSFFFNSELDKDKVIL